MNNLIKISKLAKDLGITKATLYNWRLKGQINFVKSSTGRNFVTKQTYNELLNIKQNQQQNVVIYCRVSSTMNKSNLQSQKQRLISYCCARGYKIHKIIQQFGSGLNDKRPKLQKLLLQGNYTKIIVQHKDRLTRFGFNYLKVLLSNCGKCIQVVNQVQDNKQDLIQDFVSIVTSFCARIYGQRRSKRKTQKLIKSLSEQEVKNDDKKINKIKDK